MPVTFGSPTQNKKEDSKVSTISITHTCNDATMLLVIIHSNTNNGALDATMSVSFGTQQLTKLIAKEKAAGEEYVSIYYLLNPESGVSKSVTASWNIASRGYAAICAFDVYGSDGAPTGGASATGTSTAPSVNVTSNTSSQVISAVTSAVGATETLGANQYLIYKNYGDVYFKGGVSNEIGATTATASYTLSSSVDWVIVGASIAPYTTPATGDYKTITDSIWMPIKYAVETDEFTISDTIIGGTLITDLDCRLYLGATDKTYQCMLGSTQSYSDNNYTTNKISNLRGGNNYLLVCRATIDGKVKTRKCEIRVEKEHAKKNN